MKRIVGLIVATVLILSMCGCSNKNTERTTDVVISLESDGVYGIVIEYSVDRTRLVGQMASCDPEMINPLPKEEHTIKFAEQGFGEPYTLDNGKFGILVVVVLENGEEVNSSTKTMVALAKALDTTIDALFFLAASKSFLR